MEIISRFKFVGNQNIFCFLYFLHFEGYGYGPKRLSVLAATELDRRKPSLHIKYSTLKNKSGFVEEMPTAEEEGFISDGTINIKVDPKLLPSMQEQGIFDGYPVQFDVELGFAVNIRLISKVGKGAAKESMNKQKKSTRHDAKYMIKGTKFAFDGSLANNECAMEIDGNAMEKVINAFINDENGGQLFLGIDSDWTIKGLNAKKVDVPALKQNIMALVSEFEPFRPELSNVVDYRFFAVLNKKGDIVEDMIVIRVDVNGPIVDDDGKQVLFATSSGDRFKKNTTFITKVVM